MSSIPSALYIPVHKRNRSTSSAYSSASPSPLSSRGPSPLHSARTSSPLLGACTHADSITEHQGVYTPAELLSLAHSPLAHALGSDVDARLRTVAPEVTLTRKQRKALAWHARSPSTMTGRGRPSQGHVSESDEDGTTWRRT